MANAPTEMYFKYAKMNLAKWGVPYTGIIQTPKDCEQICSNKSRVKRLCKQWNRWCDGDFSQEVQN